MGLMDGVIEQLRQRHGPQWEALVGLPIPQMGGQQGGLRTSADAIGAGRTGQADATVGNIGRSLGLGASLMGGTGALTTGLQGAISQSGFGKRLGFDNPFQEPTGSAIPTSAEMAAGLQGVPQNPTALRSAVNRIKQETYDKKKRETLTGLGNRMSSRNMARAGTRGQSGGRAGASPGGSSRGQRGE